MKRNYLAPFAQYWLENNATQETRDLIRLTHADLHFGPAHTMPGEELQTEWLGFEDACKRIIVALENAPRELWIDTETDDWAETEPTWEEDLESGEHDPETCEENCMCQGAQRAADWIVADRRAIVTAIVGRDLSEYVR